MKKYQIIYADPPWSYTGKLQKNSGAIDHYPTMSVEEICQLPVRKLSDESSALFLWATLPKIEDALTVVRFWGFTYKTCAFSWVKTNRVSEGYFMGQGRWTRGNVELCLLGTKGHPQRVNAGIRQLVVSHLQEHSQKPDEVRDRIVQLMGDLPRIELFARQKVNGWDCWGNEVESDIALFQGKEWIEV